MSPVTADRLRVVALEEHLVTPAVLRAWEQLPPSLRDLSLPASRDGATGRALRDTGEQRLRAMDEQGVDAQVLSLTTPGLQPLDPATAASLQVQTNDHLASLVAAHPDRYAGWATLATPDPPAAARELERAVTTLGLDGAMVFGRTRDRPLDDPVFWPILEVADALRAPLYLHPQSPAPDVRTALYAGFDPAVGKALATHGVGWHYETGVALLRLVLAGVFDRFPHLRIVTGHWGEMVAFYLDRIDQLAQVAHLPRKPSDYLREHLWVTPSGMLSRRYLRWTREVLGVDRVMVATDHPFVPLGRGATRDFVEELAPPDRAAVASGTWEGLREAITR